MFQLWRTFNFPWVSLQSFNIWSRKVLFLLDPDRDAHLTVYLLDWEKCHPSLFVDCTLPKGILWMSFASSSSTNDSRIWVFYVHERGSISSPTVSEGSRWRKLLFVSLGWVAGIHGSFHTDIDDHVPTLLIILYQPEI